MSNGLVRIYAALAGTFWLLFALFLVWARWDPGAINAAIGVGATAFVVTGAAVGIAWAAARERRDERRGPASERWYE